VSQGGDSFLNPGGIMIRHWYLFVWPSSSYFISHVVSRVRKYCQAGDYNYIQKGADLYRTEWCATSCAHIACDVEINFYKRCKATQYRGLFAFPDMRVSNNANHIERTIAW